MRRVLTHAVVTILVLTTTLGAAPGPSTSAPKVAPGQAKVKKKSSPKPYQVGRASWYGKYFHGRDTASGEPYDMFQFTAAHLKLPLGTYVKVTNLRNGKSVVVKINDRGPVTPGRIIDLSYGAASMLQFRSKGLERVRLDIVNEPESVATISQVRKQM
jgi:rare lipoprotein A